MPLLTQITSKQLTVVGQALQAVVPQYTGIVLDSASYNEGDTITVTVVGSAIEDGTTVGYTTTGLSLGDLDSGTLTGTVTMNSNQGTVQFALAEDGLTEGTDNFTFTLDSTDSAGTNTANINGTAAVQDTSFDPTRTPWLDDNDNIITVRTIVSPVAMQLNAVFAQNPTVPVTVEGRESGTVTTITNISANTGTIIEVDESGNSTSFELNEELNLVT